MSAGYAASSLYFGLAAHVKGDCRRKGRVAYSAQIGWEIDIETTLPTKRAAFAIPLGLTTSRNSALASGPRTSHTTLGSTRIGTDLSDASEKADDIG